MQILILVVVFAALISAKPQSDFTDDIREGLKTIGQEIGLETKSPADRISESIKKVCGTLLCDQSDFEKKFLDVYCCDDGCCSMIKEDVKAILVASAILILFLITFITCCVCVCAH